MTDIDTPPTFDVLGCTLVGPPPLQGCELRFDGSVTALYGLNGAGKSTVLDSVRAALTGIRGRSVVQIHLRIRDSVQTLLGLRRYALLDAIKDRMGAQRADPPWLEQLVRARLVAEWQQLSGETEAIAAEVAAQGLFTLVPEGRRVPEWRVFVSTRPDSDTPALNREVARLARDLRAYVYCPEDDDPGGMDAWDEFIGIVEASPLTRASNSSALFEAEPPFTAPTTLPGVLVDCGVITGPEVALLPLLADTAESIHEATLAAIAMDERGRRVSSLDPVTGELKPVLQRLDKRKAEHRFVIEFGTKALTAGSHERVTIYGFHEADILYYLPADHFVPGAGSWAELLERHSIDATKLNFKDWLVKALGTDLSDDNIRAAVRRLDAIPPEFTELLDIARGSPRLPPPPAIPA